MLYVRSGLYGSKIPKSIFSNRHLVEIRQLYPETTIYFQTFHNLIIICQNALKLSTNHLPFLRRATMLSACEICTASTNTILRTGCARSLAAALLASTLHHAHMMVTTRKDAAHIVVSTLASQLFDLQSIGHVAMWITSYTVKKSFDTLLNVERKHFNRNIFTTSLLTIIIVSSFLSVDHQSNSNLPKACILLNVIGHFIDFTIH